MAEWTKVASSLIDMHKDAYDPRSAPVADLASLRAKPAAPAPAPKPTLPTPVNSAAAPSATATLAQTTGKDVDSYLAQRRQERMDNPSLLSSMMAEAPTTPADVDRWVGMGNRDRLAGRMPNARRREYDASRVLDARRADRSEMQYAAGRRSDGRQNGGMASLFTAPSRSVPAKAPAAQRKARFGRV